MEVVEQSRNSLLIRVKRQRPDEATQASAMDDDILIVKQKRRYASEGGGGADADLKEIYREMAGIGMRTAEEQEEGEEEDMGPASAYSKRESKRRPQRQYRRRILRKVGTLDATVALQEEDGLWQRLQTKPVGIEAAATDGPAESDTWVIPKDRNPTETHSDKDRRKEEADDSGVQVYDYYYCGNSSSDDEPQDASDSKKEAIPSPQSILKQHQLEYGSDDDKESSRMSDDMDSNDEDNPRNDYPDEDEFNSYSNTDGEDDECMSGNQYRRGNNWRSEIYDNNTYVEDDDEPYYFSYAKESADMEDKST